MTNMIKTSFAVAIAVTALALAATPAGAQERFGDAAMGALAGAVVLGPIGAVAGGVVGYTHGPNIARGLGLKGHSPHRASAKVARQ
jgi:hypothetical protein